MSNQRMTVSMVMELVDKFSAKSGRINKSISSMSRNGQKAMNALKRSTSAAFNTIDQLGNRYTAFATGVGGTVAIRNVAMLETRLGRLGIQAQKSSEEIRDLYKSVVMTAQASDIRIDPTQIMDGIDKIIEKTGDFDLAVRNIRNIGLAVQASGAMGVDIGAMIADLDQKFGVNGSEGMKQTLDLMVNQGKAGAFTLENLAAQGERVTAAYSVTGRVSKNAAREMGAMLQVARQTTGSAEMAATAFEALMRTLNDGRKRKLLSAGGIQLMDSDDPNKMRSVVEIVKDLIRATNGDVVKLSSIFDAEAIRSINGVAAEFKKTGQFGSLDKFMAQTSDGATLLADAAKAADFSASKWQMVMTALNNSIFNNLITPITELGNLVGMTNGKSIETAATAGLYGGLGIAGLSLGAKAYRGIKAFRNRNKGSGLSNTLSGGVGNVQRVAVVNWPISLGATRYKHYGSISDQFSKTGTMGATAGKINKASRFSRLGRGALRSMPYAGLGFAALDIGSAAMNGGESDEIGQAIGATGGAVAGMAAGAAIGSIVPVVGTAIGAAIGGVLGQYGGGKIGEGLGGLLKIHIDSEGRPKADIQMDNKSMKAEIKTGEIMGGAL